MIIPGKVLENRTFTSTKGGEYSSSTIQTETGLLKIMTKGNGVKVGQVGDFSFDGNGKNSIFGEFQPKK